MGAVAVYDPVYQPQKRAFMFNLIMMKIVMKNVPGAS